MQWITDHWSDLFIAITTVVTAASALANLTPGDSDNRVIDAIKKVVDALALNWKKPAA